MKRHEAKVLRAKLNATDVDGKKEPGDLSEDSGQLSDIAANESDDPDVIASRLLEAEADDKNKPVEMIWDPLPLVGDIDVSNGQETDPDWARAGPAERLSAAGAAASAPYCVPTASPSACPWFGF